MTILKKNKTLRNSLALCAFLSGLATLFPNHHVLHSSLLGYNALCPFVPMSTALLWGFAGFLWLQPIRMRNRKPGKGCIYTFSIMLFIYGMIHSGYLGMIGLLSWEGDSFPPIDLSEMADGLYTGKSNNIGKKVVMQIEVKEKKIVAIKTISIGHASTFGQEAFKHLPERILKAQSIKVDSVTGASHSCKQIKAAIYNALQGHSSDGEKTYTTSHLQKNKKFFRKRNGRLQ